MPKQDYYAGTSTIQEQFSLFIQHHSDKRTRHLSSFEVDMLRAIEDLLNHEAPLIQPFGSE